MTTATELYGDRLSDAKKGDFGKIAVVGGSTEYPNTPAIAAMSVLRAGADVSVIFAPERSADRSASFAPDLITRPLDGDRLETDHVPQLAETLSGFDALVIGNGLGTDSTTLTGVEELLEATELPVVIDADALHSDIRSCDFTGREVLLTPHRGEFDRLYEEPGEELALLKEQVEKASRILGATVLLKGPRDVVSDGERRFVNELGNPYMTKGGTGDVLAGVCGALLARTTAIEAGYLGAEIIGRAGDYAAAEVKQSMVVEDLMQEIPAAIEAAREDE
jgi:NAD(P)H-hydrate epimerase